MRKRPKSASGSKPTLASELRLFLVREGVAQDEFAICNHIDQNSFRTQLARNTFSQAALEKVAKMCDCTVEDLHLIYDFKEALHPLAGVISPFEAIKRLIKRRITIHPDQPELWIC